MTIKFLCDRCDRIMDYDVERYKIVGNLDKYDRSEDLCSKCLDAVHDFIHREREEEDMDTSLRFKRRVQK